MHVYMRQVVFYMHACVYAYMHMHACVYAYIHIHACVYVAGGLLRLDAEARHLLLGALLLRGELCVLTIYWLLTSYYVVLRVELCVLTIYWLLTTYYVVLRGELCVLTISLLLTTYCVPLCCDPRLQPICTHQCSHHCNTPLY